MSLLPKASESRRKRPTVALGRKRIEHAEPELFPIPETDPDSPVGLRLAELMELEERFADGEMTWPEYSQRIKELAGRDF